MRLILFADREGNSYNLTIEYYSLLDNSEIKGFYLWELNKVYVNKELYHELAHMAVGEEMRNIFDSLLKLSNEEFLSMQYGEYEVKFLGGLNDIISEERFDT